MNFSAVLNILGYVLRIEAAFMVLPFITAIIYREKTWASFLITMMLCYVVGFLLGKVKKKHTSFFTKEGFTTVALSWIVLSFFGALPFWISGEIPSFTDALFETVSGFTTTGASILNDVEALSHACLFWRSFTHWVGGMGVLVFLLAIMPLAGGQNMHLMRAESPGPKVGKLVPKMRTTAMLLYKIYFAITIAEIIFLLFGGMPLFEALTVAFGTAGTGGFAVKNSSLAEYSVYLQTVVTVFMILFGINFNVYFLFLVKKPKQAFQCEEMRYYLGLIFASGLFIAWNTAKLYDSFYEAIHHAFFQVASIITTTGFATADFDLWPAASKTVLLMLMFVGACAGSTGGGIKVSRILILLKTVKREITSLLHPRTIRQIRVEGKPIEATETSSVGAYLAAYFMIFVAALLLISLDKYDFETNFSAITATFNNIGPGFSAVGATCNYSGFNILSKFVMMFAMLAGRLEVFPMLLIFAPGTWKR